MRKLVKTINTIDEFDMELFNSLDIGVEIQDFTESNLSMEEILRRVEDYKEKLKDFKGIKSLHGPFLDLKPASPDLKIREVSYNRYLNALSIAEQLDLDYIIFHSQINPYINEPFMRELNNKQNRDFWEEVLKETDFKGTILIENIFEETPEMLKEYIETIDMPNIKIILDMGHAKIGKADLEDWIVSLKDHIVYMHIHSNNGIYDEHKAPTKEEIHQLYNLLDKYNLNPILSLEYRTDKLKGEIIKFLS